MKGKRKRQRETRAISSGRERSDTRFFPPRSGVIALNAAVNGGQKTRLYFPPAGASEAELERDQLMGIDRKCLCSVRGGEEEVGAVTCGWHDSATAVKIIARVPFARLSSFSPGR